MLDDFRPSWILHEDDDLIVVHKEAGVPSQAAREGADDDLVSRLRRHLAAREGRAEQDIYLGVHQRLDRDTSGCVLFTRRAEANAAIAAQFESREVSKTYVAVVSGRPELEAGRVLRHYLSPVRGGLMQVSRGPGRRGKLAVTRIEGVRRRGSRVRVELGCHTGRTHQLRVQLAHQGAPVAGDPAYGGEPAMRLMLHAHRLSLVHPSTGEPLRVTDPVPVEFDAHLRGGLGFPTGEVLERALELAAQRRFALWRMSDAREPTSTFRWVHMEADGMPGLSVDVYDRWLVVGVFDEALMADADRWLDALDRWGWEGIYLKVHPRQKNEVGDAGAAALSPADPVRGRPAPERLVVHEYGVPYGVFLADGLRTGLFLDQRDNRRSVAGLAAGQRVLNLFAYTCGFSVAALAGGAREVVSIDVSGRALRRGEDNVAALQAGGQHRARKQDVFEALPRLTRRGERFDGVILDPPSYATTRGRRFVLKRDYLELCRSALPLVAPGGWLLACLNHHGVSQQRLRRDVKVAAQQLGIGLESVRDVPAAIDFPAVPGAEPLAKSVMVRVAR